MKVAKFYLLGFGLFSLVFGIAYLVAPLALTGPAGFGPLSPSATTDIRATYGGFQIGSGAFLVWSAQSRDRFRPALLLAVLMIGAVFSSRVIGIVLDGDLGDFHRMGLVLEATLTAATIFVLRRARDEEPLH